MFNHLFNNVKHYTIYSYLFKTVFMYEKLYNTFVSVSLFQNLLDDDICQHSGYFLFVKLCVIKLLFSIIYSDVFIKMPNLIIFATISLLS